MKDKRKFDMPSSKIINKMGSNIAELLEFKLDVPLNGDAQSGRFLVNIAKVLLVTPCPQLNPGPSSNGIILGTTFVRSIVVPVLDLGCVMGAPKSAHIMPARDLIVLSFMGAKYAILVSEVVRIHYLNWKEIYATESGGDSYLVGVTRINDNPVSLIDLEKIVIEAFHLKFDDMDENQTSACNRRLAIIDDSQVIRELIKTAMLRKGAKIDMYPSAVVFLEQQKKNFERYDDLIVDIEMPGMDGLTLTGLLRQDRRYAATKIYVYSSLDQLSLRKMATEAGADSYIVKHDVADLWAAIEQNSK